jgi:Predicted membrane protein
MTITQTNKQQHPAMLAEAERRSAQIQLRIADAITAFAGSMKFVYLHAVVFAVWMLVFEKSPWPTLTLIVSLEAIFLSTFVMIGQNRQASFQQAKADHDFVASELELHSNTELTKLVHQLTTEIHARLVLPADPKAGDA